MKAHLGRKDAKGKGGKEKNGDREGEIISTYP